MTSSLKTTVNNRVSLSMIPLLQLDEDGDGVLDREEWTRWWVKRCEASPSPEKQQEVCTLHELPARLHPYNTEQRNVVHVASLNLSLDTSVIFSRQHSFAVNDRIGRTSYLPGNSARQDNPLARC